MKTVLVIGSTGQIGRVVVTEALEQGLVPLAQSRHAQPRTPLPDGTTVVQAQPTSFDDLRPLVREADAVVLAHGGDVDGQGGRSFYDVVAALLEASSQRPELPIALMTSMNTSLEPPQYDFIAWKRRAERLLRASGRRYTIVRPGWFGYQAADEQRIELLQGDRVRGQRGVDPRHVAQVLLASLITPSAAGRTVEVFSTAGAPVTDYEALFAATRANAPGALDGVLDADHVALSDEPVEVRQAIGRLHG